MAGGALTQLGALNRRLTVNQKVSLLALGTVIFFGIWSFVYLFNSQPYQLLVSDVDADNAGQILERLEQMGIPYQLSQGGGSISVPLEHLDEARIEIASEGLPDQGRIGFSIFDQNNWTMTELTEKVNFQRALQGELEKTILGLSEITHARVHLVLEKDALFADEARPAKASVIIRLRPGSNLGTNRVLGVTNLVAGAVEGLRQENVTVVDIEGNVLSGSSGSGSEIGNGPAGRRQSIEQELAQKVISTLEALVGKEKVRATASVVLEDRIMEQTEEIFDPQNSVVLSQQRTEDRSGNSVSSGGVPGSIANSGSGAGPGGNNQRLRTNELVNYEVNKTVRHIQSPQGSIRRISTAVVIDNAIAGLGDELDDSETTTRVRTPEEMERFRKVVSAIVGFDEARGDTLIVENIPFQETSEEFPSLVEESFLQKYRNVIQPGMRYLGIIALFGLFYWLIFRPVKAKVFSSLEFADPEFAQLAAATGDDAMVHQLQERLSTLQGASGSASEEADEFGGFDSRERELKRQLIELSTKEPETVTHLIKSWLEQDV